MLYINLIFLLASKAFSYKTRYTITPVKIFLDNNVKDFIIKGILAYQNIKKPSQHSLNLLDRITTSNINKINENLDVDKGFMNSGNTDENLQRDSKNVIADVIFDDLILPSPKYIRKYISINDNKYKKYLINLFMDNIIKNLNIVFQKYNLEVRYNIEYLPERRSYMVPCCECTSVLGTLLNNIEKKTLDIYDTMIEEKNIKKKELKKQHNLDDESSSSNEIFESEDIANIDDIELGDNIYVVGCPIEKTYEKMSTLTINVNKCNTNSGILVQLSNDGDTSKKFMDFIVMLYSTIFKTIGGITEQRNSIEELFNIYNLDKNLEKVINKYNKCTGDIMTE